MKADRQRSNEIRRLKRVKDTEIDTTDIPERVDWSGAVVGKFYRPVKQQITLRLDSDVMVWLRKQGRGYQTRINRMLRDAMAADLRRSA